MAEHEDIQRELAKLNTVIEDLRAERKDNYVSLREHFNELWVEREKRLNERWASQDNAVTAAFAAAKEALVTATSTLDRRLELLNELRGNVLERAAFEEFVKNQDEKSQRTLEELGNLRSRLDLGPQELEERSVNARDRRFSMTYRMMQITVAFLTLLVVAATATHGFTKF
jgi:hypothetical protein